jgi:hypothetical protein
MDRFTFPAFTSVWVVLSIIAAEVVLFHLLLVFWLKIGKRAWKIVDYIWLRLAALRIFGAAGQARQLVATKTVASSSQRTQIPYMQLLSFVDQYSQEGPVCRTSVRSQFSPPSAQFQRAQRDYDSVCRWFWDVQRKLPRLADLYPDLKEVDPKNLASEPDVPETELRETLRGFHNQVSLYNTDAKEYGGIVRATKQSSADQLLVFLSPLLLSFAIALRITKVTGELRLG